MLRNTRHDFPQHLLSRPTPLKFNPAPIPSPSVIISGTRQFRRSLHRCRRVPLLFSVWLCDRRCLGWSLPDVRRDFLDRCSSRFLGVRMLLGCNWSRMSFVRFRLERLIRLSLGGQRDQRVLGRMLAKPGHFAALQIIDGTRIATFPAASFSRTTVLCLMMSSMACQTFA